MKGEYFENKIRITRTGIVVISYVCLFLHTLPRGIFCRPEY
jgi:hypothetical protein